MTLAIEVFSDVICPWCLVGKRRLEGALQTAGLSGLARIAWRPFELNPGMPAEGMERRAYRAAKFGSWEVAESLDARLAAVGQAEGIPFAFDKIRRTPNTFDAHRLIWYAGQGGVQDAVVEALFRAYFLAGRDAGNRRVLSDVAVEAGMDGARVAAFLSGDAGSEEVRREEQRARELGISAVPHFLFNGRWQLSGAQPPEVMAEALRQAATVPAL